MEVRGDVDFDLFGLKEVGLFGVMIDKAFVYLVIFIGLHNFMIIFKWKFKKITLNLSFFHHSKNTQSYHIVFLIIITFLLNKSVIGGYNDSALLFGHHKKHR